MRTEDFERAVTSTRRVLSNVTKDDFTQQTPCASWTVRDLINHMTASQAMFTKGLDEGTPGPPPDTDFADGDYIAAFADATRTTLDAFSKPGALDQTLDLPWGPTPATVLVGMAATETFQHGWDLARATGQDTNLDPQLAEMILEDARTRLDNPEFRGTEADGKMFAPPSDAPADAPPADTLAAYLGRSL
jgi:uncharacterized protein (TIGR03086 family)